LTCSRRTCLTLLQQIDGREIGKETLRTAGAAIVEIPMTLREKIPPVISCGQKSMFALMLVVIYGIIGELSSPGAILPGWPAPSR